MYREREAFDHMEIEPLSSATTPGQSGPGSDGNEGVLCIPQSCSITGTSPSNCLISYPGHLLGWGVTILQRSGKRGSGISVLAA